jgi:UDP-GlcNAc:undecaprenyl-phosphate/decaprenyl-phosphate GlcNAc-1-phosphate transferase
MVLFIVVFAISLILTLLLSPVARRIALSLGAVDRPSRRKVHKKIIARFGGLSIFASFLIAMLFGLNFHGLYGINFSARDISGLVGVMIGGALITLIGLVDDLKGLSAFEKLIGQIVASGVAVYFGVQILYVSTPFYKLVMLGAWAPILTVMWMVAITNAMNLIDGLDGLACGITVIAAAALFIVALKMGQMDSALILCALCGVGIGFLRFNFFPASIFLGDSGSLFLGFALACASIVGVLKSTLVIALIIPVAVLAVPIFDTAAVIIRRAMAKRSIFEADKRHLHHRLLKAGFNQREVVVIIYIACFILSLSALAATAFNNYPALVMLSILVVLGVIALDFAKDILRNLAFLNGREK